MDLVLLSKTGSLYHQKTLSNCTASFTGMSYKMNINLIHFTHPSLYNLCMVGLTVLKFKLEILRSVVDASGGPPIFRLNCGQKNLFFWRPPPLTSGSGWLGRILFSRSGSASEYQVLLYSWDFFPNCMRSHWLLQGHVISNNKIVSPQKFLSRQHCKIYDVNG